MVIIAQNSEKILMSLPKKALKYHSRSRNSNTPVEQEPIRASGLTDPDSNFSCKWLLLNICL